MLEGRPQIAVGADFADRVVLLRPRLHVAQTVAGTSSACENDERRPPVLSTALVPFVPASAPNARFGSVRSAVDQPAAPDRSRWAIPDRFLIHLLASLARFEPLFPGRRRTRCGTRSNGRLWVNSLAMREMGGGSNRCAKDQARRGARKSTGHFRLPSATHDATIQPNGDADRSIVPRLSVICRHQI